MCGVSSQATRCAVRKWLTVPHPPSAAMANFHVQPESVHAEESGVARFQCQIHGLPEPVISWEKDGRPVDTGDERWEQSSSHV